MDLADLIAPEGVYPSLKAKTKKQALQDVAQKASALTGIDARDILDTLLQRERLGSGVGAALPSRTAGCRPSQEHRQRIRTPG
jgi:PTS system nitrogen regulatory IIA component